MVQLLNEIEVEYDLIFFPEEGEEITEEWKRVRAVAMPSFLTYFNQGPMNYEEQVINWVADLYTPMNDFIESKTGVKTEDFITFYNQVDDLTHRKLTGFGTGKGFEESWLGYSQIKIGVDENAPSFVEEMMEGKRPLFTMMADKGIIHRFKPEDLVANELPLEKINFILHLLSCKREEADFLYYTSTNPANVLYASPVVDIGNNLNQVFEVKQVIHAIDKLLEQMILNDDDQKDRYAKAKGNLFETRVISLFEKLFQKDYSCFSGYYVEGHEQDILFLWKDYAFVIEAKAYNMQEPMRDPDRAFSNIKNKFRDSVGYGYKQAMRVVKEMETSPTVRITSKKGVLIEEIETSKFRGNIFPIVINQKSFGQIQNDLSTLLEVGDAELYPWVVKLEDLEVFFLAMLRRKKNPYFFVDYLLMREELHVKLFCSD